MGGYRPGANGVVDALLVDYYDGASLRFAGKVRAGFVPHLRRELAKAMKLCTRGGVTADEMREMRWVQPKLIRDFTDVLVTR